MKHNSLPGPVSPSPEALDWESTLAQYHHGLLNVLRGFGTDATGYNTWVPEEDTVDSMIGLAEAMRDSGQRSFSLRMHARTREKMDIPRLMRRASEFGISTLNEDETGAVLTIMFAGEARTGVAAPVPNAVSQAARTVNEAPEHAGQRGTPGSFVLEDVYGAYLLELEQDLPLEHRGPLSCVEGLSALATLGAVTLEAEVDRSRNVLKRVAWQGAEGQAAILLELFARILEGLPVEEAADHGLLRIEAHLRADRKPSVDGIVIAERLDAAFNDLNLLARMLFTDFCAQNEFVRRTVGYEVPPSEAWRKKSPEERKAEVEGLLGLEEGAPARVVRLEGMRRVVIALPEETLPEEKQPLMLEVERRLRRSLDPGIEVYMEPRTDANKLRQQKGVKI